MQFLSIPNSLAVYYLVDIQTQQNSSNDLKIVKIRTFFINTHNFISALEFGNGGQRAVSFSFGKRLNRFIFRNRLHLAKAVP